MKIISGPGNNSKLGKNVCSWSRPVGPSCPSNCAFLTGRLPDGELLPAKKKWGIEYNHAAYGWPRQIGDLKAERDALKAEVEQLRVALERLMQSVRDEGCECWCAELDSPSCEMCQAKAALQPPAEKEEA